MADNEKFIIEILLEARNRASEALKSVGVDVDNLQKNLKGAEKTVDSFDRHLSQLDAHVTKARDTIRSLNPTLDALDRKFKSLSATTVAVDKGLDKAARGLEKLAPALAAAERFADSLEEKLGQLDKKLTEIGARDVQAKVDADTSDAESKVDALTLRLLKLERDRIKLRVGIEQEILDREIAQTEAKLAALGRDDIVQRVRLDVQEQNQALIDEKARAATKSFENDQQRRRAERRKTADNLVAEVNRELDAESDALAKLSIEEEAARHASEQRDRDRASARAEERRREAADLEADLRRQLDARDKIRRQAEEDANKFDATNAGRAFSSKQRQEVQFEARGLGQLRAEMESLNIRVQQLKNQDVGIRAVLDSKEFNREYEAIRRRILELAAFKGEVHVGMDKAEFVKDFAEVEALAARLGLKKETIKVVVDFDRSRFQRISQEFEKFQKRAEKVASDFGDNFQITLRGVINGALRLIVLFSEPLLSALTGVVGGLVAVAAAAGSAVGGLIGLASAAGAQAIPALGTLAFALSRVSAVAQAVGLAYKEQQKSGQQQISLDQARASAADAITSAQEGLVKAQRAVIDSQKELTDARREGIRTLTDLALAEENAALKSQKSRLALASTIGTGSGSVIEAELQARGDSITANRARVDNRRAQAGGIESLPAVQSARKQLQDSVDGVTAARRQLAAADRQAAAASERMIASANAFEQAFGQLSRGEKKLFAVFHNENNTGLLDLFQNNLDSPIRKTTDTVLGGVARMAEGIRRILLSPEIDKALKRLGKSLAGVFDGLRTIKLGPFEGLKEALVFFSNEASRNLKPLGKIVGDLVSIFVSLAKAGSGPLREALDGVARFFGDLSEKAGSKSGQNFLANFFEQGLKSLAAFLRLGGAFLHLFLAIIGPGGGADEGVKGIDRLTASINRAADYIEANGKKVRKFFHDSIDVTSEVLKIFVGIGKALIETFDPKSVKAFSEFLTGFVFPAIVVVIKAIGLLVRGFLAIANSPVGRALGIFTLALGAAFIAVGELVGFVAGLASNLAKLGVVAGKIGSAITWLGNTTLVLRARLFAMEVASKAAAAAQWIYNGAVNGLRFAGYLAGLAAKTVAEKAAAAGARALAAAQWLINVAMSANPIVLAVAAIVALGAAFYLAYKKIKPFHEAVDAVIGFIKKHWVTIVEVMLGPLGLVIAGLRKWGPGILRVVRNVIGDVLGFFRRLPGRIGDILSDGIHNIGHVFESIGSRIVKAIVKGIKSAPKALWNALKDILPGPLKGAIGVIGKGLDAIGLATGARIGGNPSDGDSVHVRVKPGEVILNEDQQRQVGPSRINRALSGAPTIFATGQGYATGGGRAKGNAIDTGGNYAQALIGLLKLTSDDTDKIADQFTQMRSRIRKTLKNLNADANDSWSDFYKTTRRALARISNTFTKTFKNIADVVYDAFRYIARATNNSLDALGADPVKFSLSAPKVGNTDQQMAGGGVAGFIGNQGERGADKVHTILGRGEAVLNWAHQRLVEPAMNAMYGFGLNGMFKRVNAKHAGGGAPSMMAGGGYTGPGHSGAGFTPVWNLARSRFGMTNFTGFDGHNKISSTGNNISDHWYHRALDMSNGILTKQEDALNNFFKTKVPQIVKQLIWRDVDQFNGYPISGHRDHVHLAMKDAYAFNADRTAKILSRAMRGLSIDDLLVAASSAVGGGQTVDHVDKARVRGKGPLARAGNKLIEHVRRAANKEIDRKANSASPGAEVARSHYDGPLNRVFAANNGVAISFAQAVSLLKRAGFPSSTANLFGHIAVAESSLQPGQVNSIGATGLWQIYNHPDLVRKYGNMRNPWNNARAAYDLWKAGGTQPWIASKNAGDGGGWGKYASRGGFIKMADGGRPITATVFGSEGDYYDPEDANDKYTAAGIGYRGDNLRKKKWAYAEIADHALGHKPRGYKYLVSRGDKSAVLGKYDINGFDPGDGRKMDIWIHAAKFLNHFEKVGKGLVKISEIAQSTPLGPYGSNGALKGGPFGAILSNLARGGFIWGGAQAKGGDYIVDKPTMFMAGEAGRERATFIPMASGGPIGGIAKINVDPTDPTPIHRTNTGATMPSTAAPAAPRVAPVAPTPTPSDTADVADSATRASHRAAKQVKTAIEKLYDKAISALTKALSNSSADDTSAIADAAKSIIKTIGKLNTRSKKTLKKFDTTLDKALDKVSQALDAILDDNNGIIARFETAAAARSARIDLGTQKSRVKVTGKGRETRAQATFGASTYERRVLGDLGQKRDDLRTEDSILKDAEDEAREGLKNAGGNKKLARRFKQELTKIKNKRGEVAKALADNADAILAQQDVVAREALGNTTSFFDAMRTTYERAKRRLKAKGKENPASIASDYDKQIAANNDEVRELSKQMAKALSSGNMKLAQEIHDKIDELNTSTEELLAAKFQAAIDAVNDDAAKKLAFNGVQQKLAGLGVTVAQAAQFATTGTGIDGARLGTTNYGALGTALVDQGNIMRQQRSGLSDLLAQAQASGNDEQIRNLTQQIAELDASIVENAKAVRDNTDAANAAAAEARRTPLDQALSINNSGMSLLKSIEALGVNTTPEQQKILSGNTGLIVGQKNADSTSFAEAVNTYLPGGADANILKTLSGSALISYIRGVVTNAQNSGTFNPNELAALVALGNNVISDETALNENTKALKDLTGSLTQTFTSTAWERFRQAVFDGNGGLMPQYSPYIPSFGGGGVKKGDGIALLHDREVIFTPEQITALGGAAGGVEETHLHITSPVEKFDPVWASRQLAFARRNR